MSIYSQFEKAIRNYRLLRPGAKVLLGVSGGADSLAMLYLFDELRKIWGLKLYVAHLNHGLRRMAEKDLDYVRQTCLKLGLPFISGKIKIKKASASLEELAREARLDFFIRNAMKIKANAIALGHTMDDQAETVLMRLLRGSGLLGLGAILPKKNIKGVPFIRPLIDINRVDIERYLKKIKVKPRQDITNKEQIFFRNRIRHELIPLLRRGYNPNIKEVLAHTARVIAADYDYIYSKGADGFKQCAKAAPGKALRSVKIDLEKFKRLPSAMQSMVLRLAIERLKGDTRRFTFQHLLELEDLIANRKNGSVVDLSGRLCAKKVTGYLFVSLRKS